MDYQEAINAIMRYDSDTFSGPGWEVDEIEARKMLSSIIRDAFDNHVDGVWLTELIEKLRDTEPK